MLTFEAIFQSLSPELAGLDRKDARRRRAERALRVWLWRGVRDGRIPAPVKLGLHKVAWVEAEWKGFLTSRPRVAYAPKPKTT